MLPPPPINPNDIPIAIAERYPNISIPKFSLYKGEGKNIQSWSL
jgi:hypothetical protein